MSPSSLKQYKELRAIVGDLLFKLEMGSEPICSLSVQILEDWPEGFLEKLLHAQIITPDTPASSLVCPGCEEACFKKVETLPASENRPTRHFIQCDEKEEMGRISIDRETLKRWRVSLRSLSEFLTNLLQTGGPIQELQTNRIISIGDKKICGIRHEIFICRRVNDKDFKPILQSCPTIGRSLPALLLTLSEPECEMTYPVLNLEKALFIEEERIKFDESSLKQILNRRNFETYRSNSIKKEGKIWFLSYEQKSIRLNHAKGLDYLKTLLHNPHKQILANNLATLNLVNPSEARIEFQKEDLNLSTGLNEQKIDSKALQAYKKRLVCIQSEMAEAEQHSNFPLLTKLADEKLQLEAVILDRYRQVNPELEKARNAVSKAIHRAINTLSKEHPQLGRHLSQSIQLGYSCTYHPEKEIFWE